MVSAKGEVLMSEINSTFLLPLKKLSDLLSKAKTRGVIIGGISVGLLGKPRFTADIDALILLEFEQIEHFIDTARKFGFIPRIKDIANFARRSHVLLFTHGSSGIDVDLSIGLLPFEQELMDRSKKFSAEGVSFNIPTPEDMIIMKAVAHRPKDIEDIRTIVQGQKKLDIKRIKYWVKEFSAVLEMPELWDDIEKIFPKSKR